MACRKLNITDFFRFAETEKIITHEVTDLCFPQEKINYDGKSGLVYYNYRYYSPELGRWLSRDPIEEKGGYNLYAMVANDPVNMWDYLGWKDYSILLWNDKGGSDLTLYAQRIATKFDIDVEFTVKVTRLNYRKVLEEKALKLVQKNDADSCSFKNIILLFHGNYGYMLMGNTWITAGNAEQLGKDTKIFLKRDGNMYLVSCTFGSNLTALKKIYNALGGGSRKVIGYTQTIKTNAAGYITPSIDYNTKLLYFSYLDSQKVIVSSTVIHERFNGYPEIKVQYDKLNEENQVSTWLSVDPVKNYFEW